MTTNEQKKVINRNTFITMLKERYGHTNKLWSEFIHNFEELVTEIISSKDPEEIKISFLGFLTIARVKKAKRIVTNPQTGKKQVVPTKLALRIKAGQKLSANLPKLEEA